MGLDLVWWVGVAKQKGAMGWGHWWFAMSKQRGARGWGQWWVGVGRQTAMGWGQGTGGLGLAGCCMLVQRQEAQTARAVGVRNSSEGMRVLL